MSGRSSPHSPTYEDFMRYPHGSTPPPHGTSPLSECTNASASPTSDEGLIHKGVFKKIWRRGMVGIFCLSVVVIAITVILVKMIGRGSAQYAAGINTSFTTGMSSSMSHAVIVYQSTTASLSSTSTINATSSARSFGPFTSLPPVLTTLRVESTSLTSGATVMVMLTTMMMSMTMQSMDMDGSVDMKNGFIGVVVARTETTSSSGLVSTGIKPVFTVTKGTKTITLDSSAIPTLISTRASPYMSQSTSSMTTSTSMSTVLQPSSVVSTTILLATEGSSTTSSPTSSSDGPFCSSLTSGQHVACPDLGHSNRMSCGNRVLIRGIMVVFMYEFLFT